MSLFFNSDIQKLYLGSSEVQEVYLGSTLVWSAGLPVGTTFDFGYTGNVQSVELPRGKYKLQCWGAQGGSVTGSYAVSGSKGGYSEGVITLTEKTTLYVFVGGQGTSYTSSASQTSTSIVNGGWNGGGAGVRTSRYNSGDTDGRSFPRGGGGGTDIALVTSSINYSSGRTTRDSASLLSRIIVAGGGAGASARYTSKTTTSSYNDYVISYNGGPDIYFESGGRFYTYSEFDISQYRGETVTFYGSANCTLIEFTVYDSSKGYITSSYKSGSSFSWSYTVPSNASYFRFQFSTSNDYAMTLTCEAYIVRSTSSTSTSSGKSSAVQQGGGMSGKGQHPGTQSAAGSGGAFGVGANQASTNYRYCGGGGGGGWYGGGTSHSDSSTGYVNYSGGGSGFVNTAANSSSRPSGYTGLQLDSGTTKDGSTSFESTSGGTETGHSGNGYARITVIE